MKQLLSFLAIILALAAASPAVAAPFTGPVSPFYLNNYGEGRIYVVQGTTVVNSFPYAYSGPYNESNLAVTNVVTTNGFFPGLGTGLAGQYTLAGVPTGITHVSQSTPGYSIEETYDGTSDGSHNYTVQYSSSVGGGTVIQTDANWQNPVALFGGLGDFKLGIAYDPASNSLWISDWIGSSIGNYSLSGTLLSFFDTGIFFASALGFDRADNTLWLSRGQSNVLEQWSTSGVLLQSGVPAGLPNGAFLAGDFAAADISPVPEPASLALWSLMSVAGLAAWRRRQRANVA